MLVLARYAFAPAILLFCAQVSLAANWTIQRVNHMVIPPAEGVTIGSMSGVTYVGAAGANHQFLVAMEEGARLLKFDVAVDGAGAITGFSNVENVTLAATLNGRDFEGIAYSNPTRGSVFLIDENATPQFREVRLSDGAGLQNIVYPAVFANDVNNRSFESLTRSPDGKVMWTANEDALTVDGAIASQAGGAVVRLLKFNVAGNALTPAEQYPYLTDPVHGPPTPVAGQSRNGISDLVAMPDGTLLSLERSLAQTAIPYMSRIFQVDFAGATEISGGAYASGLNGLGYTTVGKSPLWSGAADGTFGQNLEGLALGPKLANGSWLLFGVVDDVPEDPLSMNTVIAFTATPVLTGDFDADGDVDGADLLLWQRGQGKAIGAKLSEGDGDRDGDVDAADYQIWKNAFPTPPDEPAASTVPEPSSRMLAMWGAVLALAQNTAPTKLQKYAFACTGTFGKRS